MVNIVIRCSVYKDKFYELLGKFEGDKLMIGAKRPYVMQLSHDDTEAGEAHTNTTKVVVTNYENINGVDWSCLYCENSEGFLCGNCSTWCCDIQQHDITCPTCGSSWSSSQKSPITHIETFAPKPSPSRPVDINPSRTLEADPNLKRLR